MVRRQEEAAVPAGPAAAPLSSEDDEAPEELSFGTARAEAEAERKLVGEAARRYGVPSPVSAPPLTRRCAHGGSRPLPPPPQAPGAAEGEAAAAAGAVHGAEGTAVAPQPAASPAGQAPRPHHRFSVEKEAAARSPPAGAGRRAACSVRMEGGGPRVVFRGHVAAQSRAGAATCFSLLSQSRRAEPRGCTRYSESFISIAQFAENKGGMVPPPFPAVHGCSIALTFCPVLNPIDMGLMARNSKALLLFGGLS